MALLYYSPDTDFNVSAAAQGRPTRYAKTGSGQAGFVHGGFATSDFWLAAFLMPAAMLDSAALAAQPNHRFARATLLALRINAALTALQVGRL